MVLAQIWKQAGVESIFLIKLIILTASRRSISSSGYIRLAANASLWITQWVKVTPPFACSFTLATNPRRLQNIAPAPSVHTPTQFSHCKPAVAKTSLTLTNIYSPLEWLSKGRQKSNYSMLSSWTYRTYSSSCVMFDTSVVSSSWIANFGRSFKSND